MFKISIDKPSLNFTEGTFEIDDYNTTCYMYECVAPLRALLKQKTAPKKYKKVSFAQFAGFPIKKYCFFMHTCSNQTSNLEYYPVIDSIFGITFEGKKEVR